MVTILQVVTTSTVTHNSSQSINQETIIGILLAIKNVYSYYLLMELRNSYRVSL